MPIDEYRKFAAATDWSALSGAYSDFAVGDELEVLAGSSGEEAQAQISQILGYACHQDVLASSAPAVVDALLRLVDEPPGAWAMGALLEFAFAAWQVPQPPGFRPLRLPFAGTRPASTPVRLPAVLEYERRCRRVQQAFAQAAPWLADVAVRNPNGAPLSLPVRLLALAGPEPVGHRTLLTLAMSNKSASVRSQARLALAIRGQSISAPETARLLNDEGTVTRAAAAAALLLDPDGFSLVPHAVLAPLFQLNTLDDEDEFPWCGGSPGGMVADALVRSKVEDSRKIDILLEAIQEWSSHPEDVFDVPEGRVADQIGERLFLLTFGQHLGRRDYLTRDELDARQRRVLTGLDRLDQTLILFTPAACGVRDIWKDRERLISENPGGLDRLVTGRFVGERIATWPVWKWWYEAANYARRAYPGQPDAATMTQRVAENLRHHLTRGQCEEAVSDARAGGYGISAEALAVSLGISAAS